MISAMFETHRPEPIPSALNKFLKLMSTQKFTGPMAIRTRQLRSSGAKYRLQTILNNYVRNGL